MANQRRRGNIGVVSWQPDHKRS